MQEDFLHYVWQFRKFSFSNAVTTSGLPVVIMDVGSLNVHSGPDFFNARVKIGDQIWAGNVEIHINSSDWYVHGHEKDPNYDNVILHVVWNHDGEIFRKDNSVIPVLELKHEISEATFLKYENLLSDPSRSWINCERDFGSFDDFLMDNWLERLYIERLEEKSAVIFGMLQLSSNNWEEVLFKMLAKNFGLNVNGEALLSMAHSVPFSVVRKTRKLHQLEALFLGQAGILEKEIEEVYYQKLQEEYDFLKQKYSLDNTGVTPVKFFRLRPDNFPNIRLVQLAALYSKKGSLFSEIIQAGSINDFYRILQIEVSGFWETHYTFEKIHKSRRKPLTKSFIDLLVINTLVPIQFCYSRKLGKDLNEEIMQLMASLKKESNQTIRKFELLRPGTARNALQSQALIQLKKHYCDKNKCLKCNLGVKLLQGEKQN